MDDNYVALAYAVVFALIVGIGLLIGLTRGVKRSILRLVIAIVSALLAVAALPAFLDLVMTLDISFLNLTIEGQAAGTLQNIIDIYVVKYAAEYIAVDSATAGLVATLPKMLVGIFVFGVIFSLFNALGFIVYLFTKGLVDGKLMNGRKIKNHKLLGGLTGAVNGVLIAFLTLSPVLGFADFLQPFAANETVQTELGNLSPEVLKYINLYVKYGEKDGDFVKKILGFNDLDVAFFNRLTRVKNSDGTELSAADFKEFSAIVDDAAWFYENMNSLTDLNAVPDDEFAVFTDELITHANGIIDFLFENGITNTVLTDGVKYLKANREALPFMNSIPEQFRSTVGVILDEILEGDTTAAAHNVLTDLVKTAGALAPEIRYFMANSDLLGKITDANLTEAQKAELAVLFGHVDKALTALFKDDEGKTTDSLIGKAAAEYIRSGGLDTLLPENMKGFSDVIKASIFTDGADSETVNGNLYDVLSFVVDLMKSPALGQLSSIGGGDMMASIAGLLNDDFITLLKSNLSKEAVANMFAGMVSTLVTDKSLTLPLGEFFVGLGELGEDEIAAELNGLKGALGAVGGFIAPDPSGNSNMMEALGGIANLLYKVDGNQQMHATLTGKVLLSVISNTVTKMVNESAGEYKLPDEALETLYIKISTLTDTEWDGEVALIGSLLAGGAAIISTNQTIDFDKLVIFGGILDSLKTSKVFKNNYGGFVKMLIDGMNIETAAGISFDGIDYTTVSWEAIFKLAKVAVSINDSDVKDIIEESLEEFIEVIVNENFNPLEDDEDMEAVETFFESFTGALGETAVEVLTEMFEGLVTNVEEGGGGVSDALALLPPEVTGFLGGMLSGGEQEIPAETVTAFVNLFFTYLHNSSTAPIEG